MPQNVIVYVDGFNLYFSLKAKGWKKFYWLNIKELANNILQRDQLLVETKYFTSRISAPPNKVKRQGTFIEALETLDRFKIFYGNYQSNTRECRRCGNIEMVPSEKMTDVNIAVEMLADAYNNSFDTAILISADSDLTAPIKKINELFPDKKIVIAFPPERYSFALKNLADGVIYIGKGSLSKSIFSDEIKKADGFKLVRPERWR